MEFLVKPIFSVVMRTEKKTQKFLSNTRRILPHSPMPLVTHKPNQQSALCSNGKSWEGDDDLQRLLLPVVSDLGLTWYHFIPYYSLSWILQSSCVESKCMGFGNLCIFDPFYLPCAFFCFPLPPHPLPNHEYIGCVTLNGTNITSFHPWYSEDRLHERKSKMWKNKKTLHSSLLNVGERKKPCYYGDYLSSMCQKIRFQRKMSYVNTKKNNVCPPHPHPPTKQAIPSLWET